MNDMQRRLLRHGMILFLLGLVTGIVQQQFVNPRMGLAAHLEGVMNGILLIALGAAWTHVRLAPRVMAAAYGTLLYGTYANWLVTTLAAVFGTMAQTPIAGAGHAGAAWQETLVGAGFVSVGIAMLTAAVMLVCGFSAGTTRADERS